MKDSEFERLQIMENAYDLTINKIKYDADSLLTYSKLVYFIDEPIADPAIIPAFLLAKESRLLGRYVMMSGMGGDEIDAGYSRHSILSRYLLLLLARLTPKFLIQNIFSGKTRLNIFRLKEFSNDVSPENYFTLTSNFTKAEICRLIKSDIWFNDYRDKITNTCKNIVGNKKYFYLDIKGFSASHNLIYMDKASMAASVEVRVPLLDKNLAKAFFQDIHLKQNRGKARLKKYLKSLIGANYHNSKKAGFRYEINNWLLNDIDWDKIVLFFKNHDLINIYLLESYIDEMKRDVESVSMKLWTIYTLYLWIETFKVKIS